MLVAVVAVDVVVVVVVTVIVGVVLRRGGRNVVVNVVVAVVAVSRVIIPTTLGPRDRLRGSIGGLVTLKPSKVEPARQSHWEAFSSPLPSLHFVVPVPPGDCYLSSDSVGAVREVR